MLWRESLPIYRKNGSSVEGTVRLLRRSTVLSRGDDGRHMVDCPISCDSYVRLWDYIVMRRTIGSDTPSYSITGALNYAGIRTESGSYVGHIHIHISVSGSTPLTSSRSSSSVAAYGCNLDSIGSRKGVIEGVLNQSLVPFPERGNFTFFSSIIPPESRRRRLPERRTQAKTSDSALTTPLASEAY